MGRVPALGDDEMLYALEFVSFWEAMARSELWADPALGVDIAAYAPASVGWPR